MSLWVHEVFVAYLRPTRRAFFFAIYFFVTAQVVDVVFKATGKTTVFEGFLKAYKEGTDESLPSGAAEGACVRVCAFCVRRIRA